MNVDNIEAIFLMDNTSVPQWKRHIDVFHHFIWDYVEDRIVKIKLVGSEENLAYPFNKSLRSGQFESLASR